MKLAAIFLSALMFVLTAGQAFYYEQPLVHPDLLRYEGVRKQLEITKAQNTRILTLLREVKKTQDAEVNSDDPRKPVPPEITRRNENLRKRREQLVEKLLPVLSSKQKLRLTELAIQIGLPNVVIHSEVRTRLELILPQQTRLEDERNKLMRESENIAQKSGREAAMKWMKQTALPKMEGLVRSTLNAEQLKKLRAIQGKLIPKEKLMLNYFPLASPIWLPYRNFRALTAGRTS